MTDENEQTDDVEDVAAGDDPGKQTDKTFTQTEVNEIVRKRESADARALQKKLDALETAQSDELAAYKKIVDANLTEQKKSLPDAVKKLLEKLDPLEQLEWLADPENVKPVERTKIPETPDGSTEAEAVESHVKLPFGLGR